MTATLKLRDENGNVYEIPALVGKKGDKGEPGQDGYTPQKGVDYFDGVKGDTGEKGEKGTDGKDGYTPQEGVDYWTESDIAEIKTYIDESLGVIENGTY